ncbi:MAG: hypothetical protein IID33_06755, partial [Planctomycetes bacterium]|nr:hypothetical protein [Planctomycetota bacterium]
PTYGLGQIVSLERRTGRPFVTVEFEDRSSRAWALEFCPLERVDFDEIG